VSRLRLLLVDDQALFREGLRMILSPQADLEVVGEAADGLAALEAVRTLAPDVVLMDLRMPRLGGAEATRRIRAEHPATRVIVLTTFEEEQDVFDALRAGAAGYLLKDASSERLGEAIRLAARGETWLQPSVAAKLVAEFGRLAQRLPGAMVPTPRPVEPLSAREREVLRCLADGLSNKEIGRRLEISEGTVKNHMSQVLGKLQVLDRTQAALRARDLGIL
jgi:DNA-binding NarL/FixJ family response regulator